MAEVIGVRFRNAGKVYYFDPDGHQPQKGELVIVETARGMECGEVALSNREVPDSEVTQPLKRMLRTVTEQDMERLERNRERETQALRICQEKVHHHKLEMKLIDVECTFDNSKILFYFTADGRVDFRELVKDLASVLKTRIELRQIGVRDEAKMLGGLGICGRPFCCSTFLGEFQPVSIKMAKEQGLSLNPAKISGTCGRLMCCLKYEQAAYDDLLKTTPRAGTPVQTPEGRGVITEVSLMTGNLKVKLDKHQTGTITLFHKDEVRPCKVERRTEGEDGESKQEIRPEKKKPERRPPRREPREKTGGKSLGNEQTP